jgi:AGZA family xanthine/uracil permease-like MFS transporter
VGIGEGGRTGLTALVSAGLMALLLPFLPLVNLVPVSATSGALFFVGLMLFPKAQTVNKFTWVERVAVLVMILTTGIYFSLDKAMFAGFASFVILFALSGRWKQINIYLLASTLLLLLSIILSK